MGRESVPGPDDDPYAVQKGELEDFTPEQKRSNLKKRRL